MTLGMEHVTIIGTVMGLLSPLSIKVQLSTDSASGDLLYLSKYNSPPILLVEFSFIYLSTTIH